MSDSKYKSSKSVAKNKTVPISADDPRLAWNKIGQTKSRQGAEIDIVGLDGKSLVSGGTNVNNPTGAIRDSNPPGSKSKVTIPPTKNSPGYTTDYDSIIPTPVTNVVATWSGDDLVITFDWDYTDPANQTVSEFIIEFTGEGATYRTPAGTFTPNMTQTAQTLTVTKKINESVFGNFTVNLSAICVLSIDPFYNISEKTCVASVPTYVLDLPVPVITVTSIANGYSVAYTTPSQSIYDAIEIVEYESDSSTEPTGVTYTTTYWNTINPANVIVSTLNARWVKARFSSGARIFTAYSAAQKVTPTSPVSLDNTPPNEVTQVSAAWSGDDIAISYKLPTQDPGARVQIQLTAPNLLVGYFYRFPSGSGTDQTTIITKKDLFDQFGAHYSSFSGLLKSIDAADNKTAGVSFNVPARVNPLAGVTPTFTVVALSNAYSVNFILPTGAAYAEVYAKHTPWVGDPIDDEYVVYSGLSPAVIVDTDYTPVYIKIHYYDDFGNTSNYSAEGSTTPLNPGEITSFENPISFGENAVIYAGVSPTTGTRTLFKSGGIFAYDATDASPSTQIVSNASEGTPTFITTQAQIADWNVTSDRIENTLSGAPTKYTGLSATGTYSFWAGSDTTGGDSSAKFTVTPLGAVTAREMYIIGTGDSLGNLISAGGLFTVKHDGKMTATSVDITGKITASSGSFTGNVTIGVAGAITSGTVGQGSGNSGYILANEGLRFDYGNVQGITQIIGTTGQFITQSALIGGWTIDSNTISKTTSGQGKITLDSSNGYIAISNTNQLSKLAGINAPTLNTNSVFWAGGTDPNAGTNPFRVTFDGKLYATDAEISGKISAESGGFGVFSAGALQHGWEINTYSINAVGSGKITVGNFAIASKDSTDFAIYDETDPGSTTIILRTENTNSTIDPKRIFLGDTTRQVEVAKSAQISGDGTTYSPTYNEASANAYRSGGLRNMFTVSSGNYSTLLYPSANIGDVILVYDASS